MARRSWNRRRDSRPSAGLARLQHGAHHPAESREQGLRRPHGKRTPVQLLPGYHRGSGSWQCISATREQALQRFPCGSRRAPRASRVVVSRRNPVLAPAARRASPGQQCEARQEISAGCRQREIREEVAGKAMIALTVVYALLLGALVGAVAWFLERAARTRRMQTRGI